MYRLLCLGKAWLPPSGLVLDPTLSELVTQELRYNYEAYQPSPSNVILTFPHHRSAITLHLSLVVRPRVTVLLPSVLAVQLCPISDYYYPILLPLPGVSDSGAIYHEMGDVNNTLSFPSPSNSRYYVYGDLDRHVDSNSPESQSPVNSPVSFAPPRRPLHTRSLPLTSA